MTSYIGNKVIVVTKGESILSNDASILDHEDISNCTSEETDPRLVRHMIHCVKNGFQNVAVYTGDTDVVVLLIPHLHIPAQYENSDVYAIFKTGSSLRYYDINILSLSISTSFCKALPFFFAFTGCDTVSSFYHIGKCKFYDSSSTFTELSLLTEVFAALGKEPELITDQQIDLIETFVIHVYCSKGKQPQSLAELRFMEFQTKVIEDLRMLPPSRQGLVEHVKRSCLQAGWI